MAQRAFDLAFNSLLITSLQVDDGIGKYPMDTFQPQRLFVSVRHP